MSCKHTNALLINIVRLYDINKINMSDQILLLITQIIQMTTAASMRYEKANLKIGYGIYC